MTIDKQNPSAPHVTTSTSRVWPGVTRSKEPVNHTEKVGEHLIVDFWGADHLADAAKLEHAIELAVTAAGATLLHLHLHRFESGEGVTGVALLAESHITVHTWPENDYAAFDIFMCGNSDPTLALGALRSALKPCREEIRHIPRG